MRGTRTPTIRVLLLVFSAGYLLLCLAPFYANGLHLQPTPSIVGGAFDPKGLAPYNWAAVGPWILGAALISWQCIAILTPLFSLALAATLTRAWGGLKSQERTLLLGVLVLSLLLALSSWTTHTIVLTWLVD